MLRAVPSPQGQRAERGQGVVLALVQGANERARIKEALKGRADVHFAERIAQIDNEFIALRSIALGLIVESHDSDGRSCDDLIRYVRERQPGVPVVGYCRAGIAYASDVRLLAVAGVHELLFHGIDDSGSALRTVITMAGQACVADIVTHAFLPLLPERIVPFVRHVVSQPATAQHVTAVAAALGYHRKTLVNQCAQGMLPPPKELISWCRLGVVGQLLGSSRCTIESIALQLDFPSDTALRNLVKRYLGMRATEVREHGGLGVVIAAFKRALADIQATSRAAC